MELPLDRPPDLSDFLSSAAPDVPGGIVRRVSEAFGGQAALLLLDIDGLWVHPTATYPEPAAERGTEAREEERGLMGIGVPLMELRDHTLSRAIFDQQTLTLHREEWTGVVPMAGEYLAVSPVRRADEVIGLLLLTSEEDFADGTLRALQYVGAQAGAALGIAESYSDSVWRARRRIQPSLAAQVQHELLPPQESYTERVSVAGRIGPAYGIGGDLYDYAITDGGLFVAVADVSGKGFAAEHLASTVFGAVRKARREREKLPEIAAAGHRALEEISSPGNFCTMLLAQINLETREMEFLNAGHPAPILVPADPARPPAPLQTSRRNPPVGALRGEETPEYASEKHHLEPGSRLLFYTDGITERRDEAGKMLGEEGLVRFVEDARTRAPLPFVHDLLQQVTDRSKSPLGDDATAVIVDLP